MQQLELTIAGMSCGHCVGRVRTAIEAVAGTHIDRISVGAATVVHDPEIVSQAAIVAAIQRAGYSAAPAP